MTTGHHEPFRRSLSEMFRRADHTSSSLDTTGNSTMMRVPLPALLLMLHFLPAAGHAHECLQPKVFFLDYLRVKTETPVADLDPQAVA